MCENIIIPLYISFKYFNTCIIINENINSLDLEYLECINYILSDKCNPNEYIKEMYSSYKNIIRYIKYIENDEINNKFLNYILKKFYLVDNDDDLNYNTKIIGKGIDDDNIIMDNINNYLNFYDVYFIKNDININYKLFYKDDCLYIYYNNKLFYSDKLEENKIYKFVNNKQENNYYVGGLLQNYNIEQKSSYILPNIFYHFSFHDSKIEGVDNIISPNTKIDEDNHTEIYKSNNQWHLLLDIYDLNLDQNIRKIYFPFKTLLKNIDLSKNIISNIYDKINNEVSFEINTELYDLIYKNKNQIYEIIPEEPLRKKNKFFK